MRTLTSAEIQMLTEQAREAVQLVARREPADDARDRELEKIAGSARPFPHAAVSPSSARFAGIDGSSTPSPLLEHEAHVVHGVVVACVRFSARAGLRGLIPEGAGIETRLHVATAGERASPDAAAAWLRACAEWELAARAVGGDLGADVVLLDSSFTPVLSRALRDDAAYVRAHAARIADARGRAVVAVSKRLGIARLAELERRIAKRGLRDHWRVRVPCTGAVAWLVRFHETTLRVEVTRAFHEGRLGGGEASGEPAFFALLDHACHADAAPGYPFPLRAAHDACTVDGRARAVLASIVGAQARRHSIPADALVDAGARSGHAARRWARAVRPRRHDPWI